MNDKRIHHHGRVVSRVLKQVSAVVVVAVSLVGCDGPPATSDSDEPTGPPIEGVYRLVSVDGNTVPASVQHGDAPIVVQSGTFTFTPDRECTSKIQFIAPNGQEVDRVVKASYTRTGNQLNMTWEGAGHTIGTVDGEKFEMDNEGVQFVFEKQQPDAPDQAAD